MRFLNAAQIELIRERFGTPVYVYDQATLETAADEVLAFPAPCRVVARFAMKALPTAAVLRIFDAKGLHVDASSGFEAERALAAGIAPEKIQITAQEIPKDLKGLVQRGVLYNACSLHQMRRFGELFPGKELSIRVNPGLGSGHNNRGYTTWMAGGGVKGGFSHGATDEHGYEAIDGRMHIHDWHATILHLLGLDPNGLAYFFNGLDQKLVGTEAVDPIRQVLA